MRGFLTALLLCVLAGVTFANGGNSPLLIDGPVMTAQTVAEVAAAPAASTTVMR
jgi:hypothetical protein